MLSPISSNAPATATADQPAVASQITAAPAPASSQASSQTTQSAPAVDTVKISSAAQQALQEARETPAQTTKEASQGDLQAKHLLAKLAAEKASSIA